MGRFGSTRHHRSSSNSNGSAATYGPVSMMQHHDDHDAEMVELDGIVVSEDLMMTSSSAHMVHHHPYSDKNYPQQPPAPFTIDDDDDDDDDDEKIIQRDDTFDMEHGDDDSNNIRLEEGSANGLALAPSSSSQLQQQQYYAENDRPPPSFRCPLTLQVMDDPVNDGCGHCFERRAILDWLEYRDVCPISRKPLSEDALFRNGHLKLRIQEWKEDHPLYQHLDEHYADHQMQDMLSSHTESSGRRRQHSNFELMLLPQERQVLNIVKVRAHSRKKRDEFRKCMWSLGITVAIFVVGATVLLLVLFRKDLQGPL